MRSTVAELTPGSLTGALSLPRFTQSPCLQVLSSFVPVCAKVYALGLTSKTAPNRQWGLAGHRTDCRQERGQPAGICAENCASFATAARGSDIRPRGRGRLLDRARAPRAPGHRDSRDHRGGGRVGAGGGAAARGRDPGSGAGGGARADGRPAAPPLARKGSDARGPAPAPPPRRPARARGADVSPGASSCARPAVRRLRGGLAGGAPRPGPRPGPRPRRRRRTAVYMRSGRGPPRRSRADAVAPRSVRGPRAAAPEGPRAGRGPRGSPHAGASALEGPGPGPAAPRGGSGAEDAAEAAGGTRGLRGRRRRRGPSRLGAPGAQAVAGPARWGESPGAPRARRAEATRRAGAGRGGGRGGEQSTWPVSAFAVWAAGPGRAVGSPCGCERDAALRRAPHPAPRPSQGRSTGAPRGALSTREHPRAAAGAVPAARQGPLFKAGV